MPSNRKCIAFAALTTLLPQVSVGQSIDIPQTEEECKRISGFFIGTACFNFEGKTIDGEDILDVCQGGCTNWQRCLSHYPDRECKKAYAYYKNSLTEREEAPIDWLFLIGFFFALLFVACCVFTFSVCVVKPSATREPEHWELNQAYYDKHDAKYWDSVLPPEEPGDGKYAHLKLNIDGEVIDDKGNVIGQTTQPKRGNRVVMSQQDEEVGNRQPRLLLDLRDVPDQHRQSTRPAKTTVSEKTHSAVGVSQMISARMREYPSQESESEEEEYGPESERQIVDKNNKNLKSAYPDVGQPQSKPQSKLIDQRDLNSKSPVKIMYPPALKKDNSMNQSPKQPKAYESFNRKGQSPSPAAKFADRPTPTPPKEIAAKKPVNNFMAGEGLLAADEPMVTLANEFNDKSASQEMLGDGLMADEPLATINHIPEDFTSKKQEAPGFDDPLETVPNVEEEPKRSKRSKSKKRNGKSKNRGEDGKKEKKRRKASKSPRPDTATNAQKTANVHPAARYQAEEKSNGSVEFEL